MRDVSTSVGLALAMGLRHPSIYGAVLYASPGAGYWSSHPLPGQLPRTLPRRRNRKPFLLTNATRWADALHEPGGDVAVPERAGSHSDAFWKHEFLRMVAWRFGH